MNFVNTLALRHQVRVASERPPHDRDVVVSLALFAARAATILLFGLLWLLLLFLVTGLASGKPVFVYLASLVSCFLLVCVTVLVFWRRLAPQLLVPTHTMPQDGLMLRPSETESIVDSSQHTSQRLSDLETSVRALSRSLDDLGDLSKSLTEIEGRAAFLQTYMEAVLEQQKVSIADWQHESEKRISGIQERILRLKASVEQLLEQTEGPSIPTRKPR